jgi:hypothetical protein
MAQFRNVDFKSGEAMLSSGFGYCNRSYTLADMLAPGFFPERSGLQLDDLGFLLAGDGWAMARVAAFDIERRPVLQLSETAAPVASAPTIGRKAA